MHPGMGPTYNLSERPLRPVGLQRSNRLRVASGGSMGMLNTYMTCSPT